MSQIPPNSTDSDKREAANFFTKWITSTGNKDENWDEVCVQWCKQQKAARNNEADPNCSMICFKRPVLKKDAEKEVAVVPQNLSWNPLKGYKILVVNGKEECVTHVNDMKTFKENEAKNMNKKITTAPTTKYELDLGNIWTEASVGAEYVYKEKVVPLYKTGVEQAKEHAKEWSKSPEATQLRDTVKGYADKLYSQVFQTSPLNVNSTPTPETTTPKQPEDKKI